MLFLLSENKKRSTFSALCFFFLFGDKQRRGVFLPPYLYQCLEPSEPRPIWEQMKREGQVINEVAHDSKLTQITVSLANNKLQT